MPFKKVLLGSLFLLATTGCFAQCRDVILNSYSASPVVLNTFNQLLYGGTASNYLGVQFSLTNTVYCPYWSLKVRALNKWSNGTTNIDVRHSSVRFNTISGGPTSGEIGISNAAFPLSMIAIPIISRSNEPLNTQKTYFFEMKYDLIIAGGNHLLSATNGEYATMLEFTLYDENGLLLSTTVTRAAFQIYYSGNNGHTLSLQNGASNVSLGFNSSNDFANGVSTTFNSGLRVYSYAAHQIIVKAATNRLRTSAGIGEGIPVSTIQLTLSSNGGLSGIVCYSVPLSDLPVVVAKNPLTDYTYQTVLYNLKYAIKGNDPNIISAPPGIYQTSIVFILVPN